MKLNDPQIEALTITVFVIAITAALVFARCAKGQDVPSLDVARACYVEGGFSIDECSAVMGVVRVRALRAGVSLDTMLHRYTALDRHNARSAFARQLPDGDEPTWTENENGRWRALREHARAVVGGSVASPCGKASQFGAPDIKSDVVNAERAMGAGKWVEVKCSRKMANRFYVEVRR